MILFHGKAGFELSKLLTRAPYMISISTAYLYNIFCFLGFDQLSNLYIYIFRDSLYFS